jgi:hypothetical protein
MQIGMTKVKLIAGQAHLVNQYKNIRPKLQKCCANIYLRIHDYNSWDPYRTPNTR